MNRLTTDNPQNNLQTALNLFFVKDGQAWVRGGGEYPDFRDVTLYDYIRSAVKHCATSPELFDMIDDGLIGEVMADWSMDGNISKEGLLGVLYQAGWAFAELRERLKAYEDTGLWIKSNEKTTNGDKIRQLIATSDQRLAVVLWKLNEMGDLDEKIRFCRELPECAAIVERDDYVPEEKCLQCLVRWLGQPADENLWRDLVGSV